VCKSLDLGDLFQMKLLGIFVVCALFSTVSSYGRLNESQLELSQRFGQQQSEKTNQAFGSTECTFKHDGWLIQAWIINGACHQITYMKFPMSQLTDSHIAALMESNSDGKSWDRAAASLSLANLLMGSFLPSEYVRSDRQAAFTKSMFSVTFKNAHWWGLEQLAKGQKQALREAVPQF
jgi:hypothetical protein